MNCVCGRMVSDIAWTLFKMDSRIVTMAGRLAIEDPCLDMSTVIMRAWRIGALPTTRADAIEKLVFNQCLTQARALTRRADKCEE